MLQTKVERKSKHKFYVQKRFFRKLCPLLNNMKKKYGTARQATDDNIIWRMRVACRIPKALNTHSEYVMFTTFTLQRWLRIHASLLRYTYIACIVTCLFVSILPPLYQ